MSDTEQRVDNPPEPTAPPEVLYYAESTHGFYSSRIHSPESIPQDAVEITKEEHTALFEGQSQGLTITRPVNGGKPILVDNRPTPEQKAIELVGLRRQILLKGTVDKLTALQLTLLTDSQKAEVIAYRQALLDVTKQSGYPTHIQWPTVPTFLVNDEVTAIMNSVDNLTSLF